MSLRHYSLLDNIINHVDAAVRTISGNYPQQCRPNPAEDITESQLSAQATKLSCALLRIDHAGEVCAQALYQGQAMTARDVTIKAKLQASAKEENDHLQWTATRLQELGGHTSFLNIAWYTGSLMIGIIMGLLGDKWNLGFLAETERQVERHLNDHLSRLPSEDEKSHAILLQMRDDEAYHATVAVSAGAAELPQAVKKMMQALSKVMTQVAYWV